MAKGPADATVEPDAPPDKNCFVITPIGAPGSPERKHADLVLNTAIKPVCEHLGYRVHRSDTIADPSMINDAIFKHITEDQLCIVDLSFLNPNVFYELGVRHTLEKPVIHIAHTAVTKLPFDTSHHRAIFFDLGDWHLMEELRVGLKAQILATHEPDFAVSNPLTQSRGRQNIAQSGDPKDQVIADLLERVVRLESAWPNYSRELILQNMTYQSEHAFKRAVSLMDETVWSKGGALSEAAIASILDCCEAMTPPHRDRFISYVRGFKGEALAELRIHINGKFGKVSE